MQLQDIFEKHWNSIGVTILSVEQTSLRVSDQKHYTKISGLNFTIRKNAESDRLNLYDQSTSDTYDIFRQFVSWQVLDVLVSRVDDFSQLLAVDHLFKHVHCDTILELWQTFGISANNFGNCRTPEKRKTVTESSIKRFNQVQRINVIVRFSVA